MLTIKNDRHAVEIDWGKAVYITTRGIDEKKDQKHVIAWADLDDPTRLYYLVSRFNKMLEIATKHVF